MKIFLCNRSIEEAEATLIIKDFLEESKSSIVILQEKNHSLDWKKKVESKFQEVDFIIFLLGEDTSESENILWELAKAKELNKYIMCIKLESASPASLEKFYEYPIFDNISNTFEYLKETFEKNQTLLLEQYKMMVASTEKVTDQRLKVNNLFFTMTSSILSVSFLIGKSLDFSILSIVAMFFLTLVALFSSIYWEKLINSYGMLNKGKFIVIDKLEKQLRTNMFEDEWKILTEVVKYEPNSQTEIKIIKHFRTFIIITIVLEIVYLGYTSFCK